MIDVRDPAVVAALSGHRTTRWEVELLDENNRLVRVLHEFVGGTLEQNRFRTIRGGGVINLALDTAPEGRFDVNWGNARFRILQHVDTLPAAIPWGIYLPDAPNVRYNDDTGALEASVTLVDLVTIVAQDMPETTFSLAEGTNVVDAVVDILHTLGQTNLAITPSAHTLPKSRSYPVTEEAESTWLHIINDLLSIISYFTLWVDAEGVFHVSPYRPYEGETPAWGFSYGESSIYVPEWDREQDWFDVPNKVILVTSGDEDTEALVSVSLNENPESPFSIPRRKRTITLKETGIEAANQTVLDSLAQKRLTSLTGAVSNITATTAPVPLWPNTVVSFTPAHGELIRCTVSSWSLELHPYGLQSHSWREVLTL